MNLFSAETFMIIGGLMMAGGIGYALKKEPPGSTSTGKTPPVEEKSLKEVSHLWTAPEVDFREVAKIWREPIEKDKRAVFRKPKFSNPAIVQFWTEWIEGKSFFNMNRKHVIAEILALLDTEGNCPSVVNKNREEPEKGFGAADYAMLEKVPLWDHSLRVARIFVGKVSHDVMTPDAIIIALGHDLGKIPRVYGHHYNTGNHPILSRFLLDRLPHYPALLNREEIAKIIEEHHLPGSKEKLAQLLRQSDTEARKEELSRAINAQITKNQGKATASARAATEDTASTVFTNEVKERADSDYLKNQSKVTAPPPAWFNRDKLREALKLRINRVNNNSWDSASTPDGVVWFRFGALWDAIIESSDRDPDALGLGADHGAKGQIVRACLKACGDDCVIWGCMSPNHTGTKCVVTSISGAEKHNFLVPIRVSWFGLLPSDVEQQKKPEIRGMAAAIRLYRGKEEE